MALNIKNPATERLAREVAAATGETLTDAVRHSLEERLERLERCSALPDLDSRSADEILGYGADGTARAQLPRRFQKTVVAQSRPSGHRA